MKKKEHIKMAKLIGGDSFALINFDQLPRSACCEAQIEALEADRKWQEDHQGEVSSRIDSLIWEIGDGES